MERGSILSASDARIIYLACPLIAICFTFMRLWPRARMARLWWDDALAFLASLFLCLTGAAGWMHFDSKHLDSQRTRVAAYYVLAESFYAALWCARLSILYTIIRIAPTPSMRQFLRWAAGVMVIFWATLFAQLFWVCVPKHHWISMPAPQCPLTRQVGVLQLISDISADILLIVVPIRLFMNIRLRTGTKMRLIVIFGSSILTTIVSLVHAYYILNSRGSDILIAAIVEIAVSVIVCNLSVVVASFNRTCGCRRSCEEEEMDAPHVRTIGTWTINDQRRTNEVDDSAIAFPEGVSDKNEGRVWSDVDSPPGHQDPPIVAMAYSEGRASSLG